MATPGVTLTATLQTIFGADDAGGKIRITLCGFGQTLPLITGTSMLARLQVTTVVGSAGTFSTLLWGNYQITPANTFYEIAILDDKNNVVQSGMYQFQAGGTFDLSNLTQIYPPPPPSIFFLPLVLTDAPNVTFNGFANISFKLVLNQNTNGIFINMLNKPLIIVRIVQNGTGGWTFTWPANVRNGGVVNPAPTAVSTQIFTADSDGSLDAAGPMMYS
jgi:hypothetical protein